MLGQSDHGGQHQPSCLHLGHACGGVPTKGAAWCKCMEASGLLIQEAEGCTGEVLCLRQGAFRMFHGNQALPIYAGGPEVHHFYRTQTPHLHCKAGEANTSLKTASCEAGPGTTLIHRKAICIWSFLIQEFDDGCCCPNSLCNFLKCHLCEEYMKLLNIFCQRIELLSLK
jgi:hypothetical protein